MAHVTVTAPDGSRVIDKTVSTAEAHRIKKLVEADPTKDLRNFSAVASWPAVFGGASVTDGTRALFGLDRFEEAEKALRCADAMEPLDEKQRARVLHRLSLPKRSDEAGLLAELETLNSQIENSTLETAILSELKDWIHSGLRLEKPHGSAYHRLEDAMREGSLKVMLADKMRIGRAPNYKPGAQSFVIEHDWAAAFNSAKDFDGGEIHLPYESIVFEFRISGKHVCCLLSDSCDVERIAPVVETKAGGWVLPSLVYEKVGDKTIPSKLGNKDPIRRIAFEQIRAVCISLEAEAATTEICRAPHKLNRAREKLGRAPLVDYHIVKLAHRTRVAPLEDGGETEKRTSPRLHFRRGHWRHFDGHKTWIKWMLVGNPDLGFIDKHYRL